MDTFMAFISILVTLLGSLASIISVWIAIKGKKHVIRTFKSILQKMIDLQFISKTKAQETTDSLSLIYSDLLNKINNKKPVILGFVYGIITSLLVYFLFVLIKYIKSNGIEKILNLIQLFSKKPVQPSLYGGVNIDIITLLWLFVFLFSAIGAKRGWTKELTVSFSVVTALAVNLLLEKYIPLVRDLNKSSISMFWIHVLILITLTYFGYQTVNISRVVLNAKRDRLQDSLFGSILGSFNGYLIVGTILYYNHVADYPYSNVISPATDPAFVDTINRMMAFMPPIFLGEPSIYFIVIIILIFVIVVFV